MQIIILFSSSKIRNLEFVILVALYFIYDLITGNENKFKDTANKSNKKEEVK